MLTAEIINGNHEFDIPQATLDIEVKKLVEEIELKDGFSPHIAFNPNKHLAMNKDAFEKIKKFTLKDIGIEKTHCLPSCEVAATEPFPLFTEEAIEIMKWEIFNNQSILKEFGRLPKLAKSSTRTDFSISGFIENTPFTRAAWSDPETLEIMSEIAGLKLKIPHAYSMGHVNASLASREVSEKEDIQELQRLKEEQDKNGDSIPSSVHWHYDSPPLVCVLMLSAPNDMIGGETCIRAGDESVVRVSNPKKGYATFLQGRVIKHIATKPLNNADRISFVVSFIPEDPELPDTTVTTSEKPSVAPTFLNDKFYPNFLNYRFDRIEQRLRNHRDKLMSVYRKKGRFNQIETIAFCKDIEEYLRNTWAEFEAVNDDPFPPPLFSIPYADL